MDNKKILLLPWITDIDAFSNTFEESIKTYDLIFGHLSAIGFNMGGGIASKGINPKLLLAKASKTYLGHFHCRSKKTIANKSIQYIGSPYELTKIDENDKKGALILDLETLEDIYINNTVSIKYKTFIYPTIPSENEVFNNKITIFIQEKENLDGIKVDKYVKELEKFKPIDIKIELIKNSDNIIDLKQELPNITIEELFKNYLKNSNYDNKDKLYELLINEYKSIKSN